jgi:hypothetical protein
MTVYSPVSTGGTASCDRQIHPGHVARSCRPELNMAWVGLYSDRNTFRRQLDERIQLADHGTGYLVGR